MKTMKETGVYHYNSDGLSLSGSEWGSWQQVTQFTYTFENFFHPLVGELIQKLNRTSVAGMLDPTFLSGLKQSFFNDDY